MNTNEGYIIHQEYIGLELSNLLGQPTLPASKNNRSNFKRNIVWVGILGYFSTRKGNF